jgi:hypothetical protein
MEWELLLRNEGWPRTDAYVADMYVGGAASLRERIKYSLHIGLIGQHGYLEKKNNYIFGQ